MIQTKALTPDERAAHIARMTYVYSILRHEPPAKQVTGVWQDLPDKLLLRTRHGWDKQWRRASRRFILLKVQLVVMDEGEDQVALVASEDRKINLFFPVDDAIRQWLTDLHERGITNSPIKAYMRSYVRGQKIDLLPAETTKADQEREW